MPKSPLASVPDVADYASTVWCQPSPKPISVRRGWHGIVFITLSEAVKFALPGSQLALRKKLALEQEAQVRLSNESALVSPNLMERRQPMREIAVSKLMSRFQIGPHFLGGGECQSALLPRVLPSDPLISRHGAHEQQRWFVLALERMDGSLDEWLRSGRTFEERRDAHSQLSDLFARLHSLGFYHADINEVNIMYRALTHNTTESSGARYLWRLVDFGNAHTNASGAFPMRRWFSTPGCYPRNHRRWCAKPVPTPCYWPVPCGWVPSLSRGGALDAGVASWLRRLLLSNKTSRSSSRTRSRSRAMMASNRTTARLRNGVRLRRRQRHNAQHS